MTPDSPHGAEGVPNEVLDAAFEAYKSVQTYQSVDRDGGAIQAIARALQSARSQGEAISAERIARYQARLEIDHHFVMGEDQELVRVEIPDAERDDKIDGIECRDATIALLDERVEALEAQVDSARSQGIAEGEARAVRLAKNAILALSEDERRNGDICHDAISAAIRNPNHGVLSTVTPAGSRPSASLDLPAGPQSSSRAGPAAGVTTSPDRREGEESTVTNTREAGQ